MKITIITSIILCFALLSCTSDDESIYDSVLSNTSWHQIYIDVPTTSTVDEAFTPLYEILERLQAETRTAQETDTINKGSSDISSDATVM